MLNEIFWIKNEAIDDYSTQSDDSIATLSYVRKQFWILIMVFFKTHVHSML